MSEPSWLANDDALIDELGAAVREDDAVPEGFRQIARDAYIWRTVDAELAELAEDSALSGPLLRGDPGAPDPESGPRSLSFVAGTLTVELELHPDAVRGQLVPAQPGAVRVQLGETSDASGASDGEARDSGAGPTIAVDDVGWFVISPVPAGRFRLHVRTTAGTAVLTGWITP